MNWPLNRIHPDLFPENLKIWNGKKTLPPLEETLLQLLNSRKIMGENQKNSFFYPQLTDLASPFLFKKMEKIVLRLHEAEKNGEKILISSDRDVDGLTASAILIKAFKFVGWKTPEVFFPDIEMGNGLNPLVIEEFARQRGKIIITCDCGIRNLEEAQRCVDLKLDLIITDHHIAAEIPQAFAILNPKLPHSPPEFKELAACGVAYKLACAILLSFKKDFGKVIPFFFQNENQEWSFLTFKNGVFNPEESNSLEGEGSFEILKSSPEGFIPSPKDSRTLEKYLKNHGLPIHLNDFQKFYQSVFKMDFFPGYKNIGKHLHFKGSDKPAHFGAMSARAFSQIWCHRYKPVRQFSDETLDILTIGTIGDLVPLIGENRTIVKLGLKLMEKTASPGLAQLIKHTGLNGKTIHNRDVATQIIPYLNSPGRLGHSINSLELLLFKGSEKITPLMEKIISFNNKRKEMTFKTYKACRAILLKNPLLLKNPVIILCRYNSVPGVSGIVAAKLAKEFQKPIVILTVSEGMGTASCRTARNYNIYEALDHCSDLLTAYGGHPFAAGFTIKEKNIPQFSKKINLFAQNAPELCATHRPADSVHAILDLNLLDRPFLKNLSMMKPFGIGNSNPVFFTPGVRIRHHSKVGGESNNILFELETTNQKKIEALAINKAHKLDELPTELKKIDILYNIEMDSINFNHPKLRILEFSLSEESG